MDKMAENPVKIHQNNGNYGKIRFFEKYLLKEDANTQHKSKDIFSFKFGCSLRVFTVFTRIIPQGIIFQQDQNWGIIRSSNLKI